MSKSKAAPRVGIPTQQLTPATGNGKPAATETIVPPEATQPKSTTVSVPIPMWPADDGYCQRHVDIQLDTSQAETLKRIRFGLTKQHAQLASGRHVESAADAVRWILEGVGK